MSTMTIHSDSLVLHQSAQRLLFTDARSPLSFSAAAVPVEAVRHAYDLAKYGPTANNSMPMRLTVAESPEARRMVVDAAMEGNKPRLAAAPMVIVASADHDYHNLSHITAPHVAGLHERLEAMPELRERLAYDSSWLQIGYLIIGLRAAGLDVRPIGGFDRATLGGSLFEGTAQVPLMLLIVGYPADDGDNGLSERAGRPTWDDIARVR